VIGNHELHEHLESVGDARGRHAGAQRGEEGLRVQPWVKTSSRPAPRSSPTISRRRVQEFLDTLGFNWSAMAARRASATPGLSGANRQSDRGPQARDGRRALRQPELRGSCEPLTSSTISPRALGGRVRARRAHGYRPDHEPIGNGTDGPVYLRDIWPSNADVAGEVLRSVKSAFFTKQYADVFRAMPNGRGSAFRGRNVRVGRRLDLCQEPAVLRRHDDAAPGIRPSRALACSPCSATRSRPTTSRRRQHRGGESAGQWLVAHGVERKDFNSYGARRGNHEVMMRGTFANIRLRNELAPAPKVDGRQRSQAPKRSSSTTPPWSIRRRERPCS